MSQLIEALRSRKVNGVHSIRVEDNQQNGVVLARLKEQAVELLQENKESRA